MLPAVEPFKKALEKSEILDPIINVHSNVDGKRYRNAEHIKKQLPKQVKINNNCCMTNTFLYKYLSHRNLI